MSKTTNTKAFRAFDALACYLKDLPDLQVTAIANIIADERDGYKFNFISAVQQHRRLTKP